MNRPTCFIAVALAFAGCVQDPVAVRPVIPIPSAKVVYILNEGFFGQGNSTLSYYDLQAFQVHNDAFRAVNNRGIGDVGNQIVLRGTRGYIVVNNSNRIEVFDPSTIRSLGTISLGPGSSPRQIAFASDSIGLVTNLYDNSVSVVHLFSGIVLNRIAVGNNPDGIAVSAGKAVVANSGFGSGNTVSIIALDRLQVVRTVRVGDNPQGVVTSAAGEVFVVCGGAYGDFSNPADDTPARLFVIDPLTESAIDSILIGGHASLMAIGPGSTGYVPTADSVLTVDLVRRQVVGTFTRGAYYGAAVEEVSGDVYLSDVQQYAGPGKIVVFSSGGEYRTQFPVGLIPGSMAFKR